MVTVLLEYFSQMLSIMLALCLMLLTTYQNYRISGIFLTLIKTLKTHALLVMQE